ncbi:type I phosphomannose isomerase catalytic subunit [Flavicella sediminum]|uniref:type I phosphomannose isomerase catalytic subunit n=1 Tax=Flavicella sediminum TaxID=2585141 RepID=UPI0011248D3E|nr:type I phosphomannose isomerase catalytic subunit [Flavicella sediminum]
MKNNIGILKFNPIFQYRIWGGEKLKTVLEKSYTENSIGESWEISGVKGNETVVSEGSLQGETLPTLISRFGKELVGSTCFEEYGNEFPILIKFIDAKTPLSVQVHPDDGLAKERHNSLGKNEMWYIMDADEEADLLIGFKEQLDKKSYMSHVDKGDLMSVLNTFTVNKGELYYLPAGRVHAIGQGVLLAEIQQTSDVTYRVYDYDRVDSKTGEKRELHVEESIDAIDFSLVEDYQTTYKKEENQSNLMIDTPYFKTNYISANKELQLDYELNKSFKIFICTSGKGTLKTTSQEISLKRGETVLLAANEEKLTISPEGTFELLEASY